MSLEPKQIIGSGSRLRIEPLNRPTGWDIFVLPKRIKTASVEKSKETDLGGLNISAEIEKHPDHLYAKIFAIKEAEVNDNADCFSAEELRKAASTFIGVPLFTNHQNDDVEKSRGECIHAWYDPEAKGIYIVARVDKIAYPKLARGIEEGYITGTSMGCSVEFSVCSICHNKAHTADEYCSHIKEAKNRKRSGRFDCAFHKSDCKPEDDCPVCGCKKGSEKTHEVKEGKVFEWNYGLKFIENSFVVNPACHSCGVCSILHAPEVTKKVAELKRATEMLRNSFELNPSMFSKAASAGYISQPMKVASSEGQIEKRAGQLELDMLKESTDNMERVVKSMLAQKDHIDMEYVSEIVEAMKKLQDTYDELQEMGYAQLQSPPEVTQAATGQDMSFPAPATGSGQTPQAQAAQPSNKPPAPQGQSGGRQDLMDGLGSVTMPKRSFVEKKKESRLASANVMRRLTSLRDGMSHLNEAFGRNTVADVVISVWENLHNADSHHASLDKDFITIAKGDKVLKVASVSELTDDFQKLIASDPREATHKYLTEYLKESETTMADKETKTAQVGSRPEGRPQQREVITEKQLEKNAPDIHPRWGETYTQITESDEQLGRSDDKVNDTTSESPQKRRGTYETTTEDQLDKITSGYIVRAKDAPDVITEKQWNDFSRQVAAKLPGDWLETITEDQIRKLLSSHTFVGTYETITEDQLKNQDLGIKRWASKSYTSSLTKIAFEALSDTIAKFKKSPDDIRRVVAGLLDNPAKLSKVALACVITSLPYKTEDRKAVIANASYFGKIAGISESGIDTTDALIVAIAENAKAGVKAEDVFETIAFSLKQKTAMAKVDNMVKTKLAGSENEVSIDKFAALEEAIESLDGYDLRVSLEDIASTPTDKVAFVKACRKYAASQIGNNNFKFQSIKVAQDAGLVRMLIDALEDVAQKMDGGQGADGMDGNVDIEIMDGGDGLAGDGLGGEIENIEPTLNGPGGTEGCGEEGLGMGAGEEAGIPGENPEEESKPMMGGASPMGMATPMASSTANAKRAATRNNIVKESQMMGGQMGGQGGAGQAPGAGASLPQAPDMNQQPVESFNEAPPEGGEGEMDGEKKAKPPGSICPVCGSSDVDWVNMKGKCNECTSEWTLKVTQDVTKWADLFGDEVDPSGAGEDEFGGEGFEMPEGGAAEGPPGAAPAGGAMPEVPVAAYTRLTPGAIRKLAEKKIDLGAVSPLTGTTNTHKLAFGKYVCLDTGREYSVEYKVMKAAGKDQPRFSYAQFYWTPPSKKPVCVNCRRARATLNKAIKTAGVSLDQFKQMSMVQKAKLVLKLKESGALDVVKTAAKVGTVVGDYKLAYGNYGDKFPIESCREKLARRYGKNALAMSGPCEGKPLYDCVCNSLKSAGIYTDNIAIKVASAWSDQEGCEECVQYLVQRRMPIRSAITACSVLKTALAGDESFLADDLENETDDNGGDDDKGPDGGGNDGPPVDVDQDNDPFDNDNGGDESGSDNGPEAIGEEGAGNDIGGIPSAGETVTLELPAEVVEQLDATLDKALGENPAEEGHHPLPGANPVGEPGLPGATDLPGGGLDSGLNGVPSAGGVEEVGGPAELGLDKPCGCPSAKPAMPGPSKPSMSGPMKPSMGKPNPQIDQNNEGIPSGNGVMNNLKQNKPGMGAMAKSENDLKVQAELDAASFMQQRVGGVGKAAGLDYSAIAAKLGLNKSAGEKEIQQERVQESKDIGQFSAGKPANGKTVGQMGHEKDTIRDADLPSVPRSDARMGHESDGIDKEEKLPSIPSDKGTMGHESEVGLSGGDVRFTGGTGAGGAGSPGAGKSETKASANDELLTAEAEYNLRSMRGVVGNTKERENSLISRIAEKLKAKQPVSEDEDVKPYSDGGKMGHESAFSAEEPKNTEDSGNGAMIGHESDTLGSVPKSPKDHPDVPEGGSTGALMGHEGDADLNPEKQTKDKGTVIAKSDAGSQALSRKEAFRVAGRLITAGIIEASQLEEKVIQLAQYKPEMIRDYEKALFANVAAKKKGLAAVSGGEALERPLIINEASSRKSKKSGNDELVSKIQSLFSSNDRNKLAEELPDFDVRQAYKR